MQLTNTPGLVEPYPFIFSLKTSVRISFLKAQCALIAKDHDRKAASLGYVGCFKVQHRHLALKHPVCHAGLPVSSSKQQPSREQSKDCIVRVQKCFLCVKLAPVPSRHEKLTHTLLSAHLGGSKKPQRIGYICPAVSEKAGGVRRPQAG